MKHPFFTKQTIYDESENKINNKLTEQIHQLLLATGLKYDEANDYYYNEKGAYIGATSKQSEEELLEEKVYKDCIKLGGKLFISSIPGLENEEMLEKGIYCSNYQEVLNRLKEQHN